MIERRKFFSTFLLGLPVAVAAAPVAKAIAPDGPTMVGFATCSCGYHMLAERSVDNKTVLFHCTNKNCPHLDIKFSTPNIPLERA